MNFLTKWLNRPKEINPDKFPEINYLIEKGKALSEKENLLDSRLREVEALKAEYEVLVNARRSEISAAVWDIGLNAGWWNIRLDYRADGVYLNAGMDDKKRKDYKVFDVNKPYYDTPEVQVMFENVRKVLAGEKV